MERVNCWEFMKCGCEPGGVRADELGACPAATVEVLDGCNGGCNGGRSCWAIPGTLCGGRVQGKFAQKYFDCRECAFYRLVISEEQGRYVKPKDILLRLNGKAA